MKNIDTTPYRLSSYTIPVRLDDAPDKVMLVHGYTGAIDIAHKNIASFLQAPGPLDPEAAPFSEQTWNTLVSRGYITSRPVEEERAFVARMADAYQRRNKLFSTFTLIPSYDCNFRCPYCIESQMSCGGQKWSKQTFTRKMVDRAYAAMDEIGPHREFHVKQILLYGGEPLLGENKEIVRYMVEKGHALGYRFKAITNGYDLEEFRDLLNPDMIYALQITVDGTKEWHDQRRVHYRDGGSFDKIVRNIGLALEAGVGVGIRVNTDRNNFSSLGQLKEQFTELGYYEYDQLFSLHASWLTDIGRGVYDTKPQPQTDTAGNIDYFTFGELNRELKDSGLSVSCPSDKLYTNFLRAITGKTRINLNSAGCSSQSGAYVFDPKGNIYSCLEAVGLPAYALGSYASDGNINWRTEEVKRWHCTNIETSEKCSRCKFTFFCHGGCLFKRMQDKETGDYCRDFAAMFRTAANKAYQTYTDR